MHCIPCSLLVLDGLCVTWHQLQWQRSYSREIEYLFMLEQAAFRDFFLLVLVTIRKIHFFNILVFEFLSVKLVFLFEELYRTQFL
ncbi:uncharacterized protein DS421_20g705240 [Arachis hypogaea]|nr:uncharacterized protein DS421_20g705240 [Arachis hypogaea]